MTTKFREKSRMFGGEPSLTVSAFGRDCLTSDKKISVWVNSGSAYEFDVDSEFDADVVRQHLLAKAEEISEAVAKVVSGFVKEAVVVEAQEKLAHAEARLAEEEAKTPQFEASVSEYIYQNRNRGD